MRQSGSRLCARGQVIPLVAIMMVVIVGFVALVIDGGRGYLDRRTLQSAADTAALSGAGQLSVAGRSRGDLSYARAAAVSEAVDNLPGTSVPVGYAFSLAGSGTPGLCATPLQCDISGLSLGPGYTMDVQATFSTVTATLHHSLSLTFGVASGFGPSITPGATATAENGGLPFALILFRNNSTGSAEYGNLTSSGSGVTLAIGVAAGSPAGTTGDAMTNESICPAPGVVDFGSSGDMYANKTTGWPKFPGGSCGDASNVTNTKSGRTLIQAPQIANPNYPEPTPGSCSGLLCGIDLTINVPGAKQCLAPGTYSSINVKKGTLVLLPGVFKVNDSAGTDVGFTVGSNAAVTTADALTPADLGINGCPATLPSGDTGVAIDMVPTGSAGAGNQLNVNSGGSFTLHGSPVNNDITIYVENSPSGDPCAWNAGQGCGSAVVVFSSGAVYSVKGVVYGYGDNMTFGGGSGGAGLGQVFAWTVKINGNGTITETYDPSQAPGLQGLIT